MTNNDPETGGGGSTLPPSTWVPGRNPPVSGPGPGFGSAGPPGPYPQYHFPPTQPGGPMPGYRGQTGPYGYPQDHYLGGPPQRPAKGGGRTGLWVAVAIVAGLASMVGLGLLISALPEPDSAAELDSAAVWEQAREVGSAKPSLDEAECLDEQLDGSATLDEALTNPDGDAREALTQAMLDCTDDPAHSDMLVQGMAGNMELGSGGLIEVDDDEASCVIQYLMDNSANPARTMSVGDGPGDDQLFAAAFERCLDDEDLAVMRLEPGAGPQAYGDDPRLDSLWDDCGGGDDRACDILYIQSSVGSDYEQFAFDCAGRGLSSGGGCVEGITYDALGYVSDEDDSGLAAQVVLCQDGDMTACDFVFLGTVFGSEINEIGYTCGGRIAVGALPDCRTRFGD